MSASHQLYDKSIIIQLVNTTRDLRILEPLKKRNLRFIILFFEFYLSNYYGKKDCIWEFRRLFGKRPDATPLGAAISLQARERKCLAILTCLSVLGTRAHGLTG